MQNCINESCHKKISLSSRPSGYCSQKCWVDIEYLDMFNRRLIDMWGLRQ